MIHLVYVKGDSSAAPFCITNELSARLAKSYELAVYNWDEKKSINPSPGDILLGHPHYSANTIFRKSFDRSGWQKRIVLCPFSHGMQRAWAYLDPYVCAADSFLAITGEYWTDTIGETPFSHWAPKITRLDMAVDPNKFPFLKGSLGRPGKRKFLYIGHWTDYKGCDYLAALASANPEIEIGWIGATYDFWSKNHPDIPAKVMSHGQLDLAQPSTYKLIKDYDFFITCGRSDANPTTILEAIAWGLIPICTPQSGYHKEDWLVNIPLENITEASAVLKRMNEAPESELRRYQRLASKALTLHFNWDRFARQVCECISSQKPGYNGAFGDEQLINSQTLRDVARKEERRRKFTAVEKQARRLQNKIRKIALQYSKDNASYS